MSKSRLKGLRNELSRLQSAQRLVAVGLFVSHLLLIGGGVMVLLFLLDYTLELSVLQRLIIAALGMVAVVWGCVHTSNNWEAFTTSLLDLALGVERRHGIEGDLVAALQFDEGKASGSPQLQSAVIEYVSQMKRGIDVFAGFDPKPLWRRLGSVAVMLAALAIAYFLMPAHFQTFLARMALADRPYPTQTQIESLIVNDELVNWPERNWGMTEPPAIVVGYGRPVLMDVTCGGVLPQACRLLLRDQGGQRSQHEMTAAKGIPGRFGFELPRLIETVDLWIEAGDARSQLVQLRMIPLPLLEIELEVTPPSYASAEQNIFNTPNISVLEGSRAQLTVKSDRPLDEVEVEIMQSGQSRNIALTAVDTEQQTWRLPEGENPLTDLRETLIYKLSATDQHGLKPQGTPRGTIRVITDRAPRATASMIHKVVLPGAKPQLQFKVEDDFGLADVRLELRVERDTETILDELVSLDDEITLTPGQTSLERSHPLTLSQWNLQPGDRLQIIVAAEDDRGDQPGRLGRSEPLVLEITDESGVLAAISEADQQSEQLLGELIQRQLGIGETQ